MSVVLVSVTFLYRLFFIPYRKLQEKTYTDIHHSVFLFHKIAVQPQTIDKTACFFAPARKIADRFQRRVKIGRTANILA